MWGVIDMREIQSLNNGKIQITIIPSTSVEDQYKELLEENRMLRLQLRLRLMCMGYSQDEIDNYFIEKFGMIWYED